MGDKSGGDNWRGQSGAKRGSGDLRMPTSKLGALGRVTAEGLVKTYSLSTG